MHDDQQPSDRKPHLGLPLDVLVLGREGEAGQRGVDPEVAEQEAPQVLVALLGVDQAVPAAVTAVDERPVGAGDLGVFDLHQTVAAGSDGGRREPVGRLVVRGVGAHQTEDPLAREVVRAVRHLPCLPALRRAVRVELRRRGEVFVHPPGPEDVGLVDPEGVAQGFGEAEADGEGDAAVRRAVGEQLVDVLGGRVARALVGDDLLDQAAGDQAAHRVGDEVDVRCAGLHLELLDQYQQVLRGPLQAVVARPPAPGARRGVVEAVDPDAVGVDPVLGVEVRLLVAGHQDLVPVVQVQAQQRALELEEGRAVVALDADVGRPLVEPVERVHHGLLDARGAARVAPHVDDRDGVPVHLSTPLEGADGVGCPAARGVCPDFVRLAVP